MDSVRLGSTLAFGERMKRPIGLAMRGQVRQVAHGPVCTARARRLPCDLGLTALLEQRPEGVPAACEGPDRQHPTEAQQDEDAIHRRQVLTCRKRRFGDRLLFESKRLAREASKAALALLWTIYELLRCDRKTSRAVAVFSQLVANSAPPIDFKTRVSTSS